MVNIFNLFTLLLESQSTSCCGDSVSRPFPALKIFYIKLSRFQPEMIELFGFRFRFESFPPYLLSKLSRFRFVIFERQIITGFKFIFKF